MLSPVNPHLPSDESGLLKQSQHFGQMITKHPDNKAMHYNVVKVMLMNSTVRG